MQFSFPRSLRSKRFRASLTEMLATRAKRGLPLQKSRNFSGARSLGPGSAREKKGGNN